MVEATIEDLAITPVLRGNLTQSDGYAVLSTILLKDSRCGQVREQRLEQKRLELTCAVHSRRKERRGMALKIFTGEKLFLKADVKPFDITEIKMLPGDLSGFSSLLHGSVEKGIEEELKRSMRLGPVLDGKT